MVLEWHFSALPLQGILMYIIDYDRNRTIVDCYWHGFVISMTCTLSHCEHPSNSKSMIFELQIVDKKSSTRTLESIKLQHQLIVLQS